MWLKQTNNNNMEEKHTHTKLVICLHELDILGNQPTTLPTTLAIKYMLITMLNFSKVEGKVVEMCKSIFTFSNQFEVISDLFYSFLL